ncbi:MAG: hypothetical protein UU70_C0006G0007 [Candidatus Yanofskybacteria bacterium GW2011_GWA1_41_6]|uniref:Uncharacterized protein n=1 Tax=Candidatus Yanofskybacteria bacterium GW2011_GWA1_41_6 TaxID=1619020 RepID=A0A0G0ZLK0_9BACT|nr:MAG: hypothetical protein UU70_C0006G0007 [Candidatus Yanofskybacteria bacterium GW2011_GWA1_41_6]
MKNNKINSLIDRLELQRKRILQGSLHDADFYVLILGRIYRYIDKLSKTNSKIANLKGQNLTLLSKIRIRHYFEHEDGISIDKFPSTDTSNIPGIKSTVAAAIANIKVVNSVFINGDKALIVSGDCQWDLNHDHLALIELINKMNGIS